MKINKLLFTLALASVTASQLPAPAFASSAHKDVIVEEEGEMNFSDVSPNHWAYRSIKKLVEDYGVLGGFPDGTFRGNRNLTRYEAAAMIAKVMEKIEEMASKGGKPTGLNQSAMDRLKKEFMTELEDLQSEVKKLSKDQQDLQKDLDETKDQIDMVKDMLPKIHVHGDVTARHEVKTKKISITSKDLDQNAPQVRMRLGIMGESMGGFTFGTRISTSSANDITNHFVSVGNLGTKLGINLDKAWVGLRPWDEALDLTVGRHGNPFVKTTELVWDEDLTFDGSYLKLRFGDMNNNLSLVGAYSLFQIAGLDPAKPRAGRNSFNTDTDTSGMMSGGVSASFGGPDSVMFMVGGNYHQYTNVNNLIGKTLSLNPRTNLLTADGKAHISQFRLATGSLMLSLFPGAYLPLTVHADVSYNLGAGANAGAADAANADLRKRAQAENLGIVAGAMLGKLEEAGNIVLGFNYKMVGTDSVFSAFNEDMLGGTNITAFEGKLGFQLAPKTSLVLKGQMATKINDPDKTPGYTMYGILSQKF